MDGNKDLSGMDWDEGFEKDFATVLDGGEANGKENLIFVLARDLKAKKEEKSQLDERLKEVKAEIESLDYKLSEAMADSECEKFSYSGSTFYLTSRLFASPKAGMKDALITALRDNGYGDIVSETVNANTLASFCKEQMGEAEELPEWLSDVVSTFDKVSVGIRKGK